MSKARTLLGFPGGLLVSAVVLVGAAPADSVAQESMDSRWLPWLGCWTAVDESADGSALMCVRPAQGDDAVEFLSVIDGVVESVDIVSATGERQAIADEGCEGWQSGSFSADGHRVYLRSDEVCEGGQRRTSTSLISWPSQDVWLDVEVVDVEGQGVAWVRRYRMAASEDAEAAGLGDIIRGRAMAVVTARAGAAERLNVDDIIEASSQVDHQVVETWLAEVGEPLRLDAEKLIRMADADVPASVIDLAIAISNPDRFQLARGDRRGEYTASEMPYSRAYRPRYAYGRSYYSVGLDPFYYSRYGIGYSPYGFGYGGYGGFGFGYSPFGYGYSPFGYGGYSPIVVIQPRENFRGSTGGRVVRGRGYTRTSGGTRGTATARSGSMGSGAAAGSGSRSSGRTVRRAKPRGGGL